MCTYILYLFIFCVCILFRSLSTTKYIGTPPFSHKNILFFFYAFFPPPSLPSEIIEITKESEGLARKIFFQKTLYTEQKTICSYNKIQEIYVLLYVWIIIIIVTRNNVLKHLCLDTTFWRCWKSNKYKMFYIKSKLSDSSYYIPYFLY